MPEFHLTHKQNKMKQKVYKIKQNKMKQKVYKIKQNKMKQKVYKINRFGKSGYFIISKLSNPSSVETRVF
jgi:hypothetical protein